MGGRSPRSPRSLSLLCRAGPGDSAELLRQEPGFHHLGKTSAAGEEEAEKGSCLEDRHLMMMRRLL